VLYEHLLWLIESNDLDARQMKMDKLLDYYKYQCRPSPHSCHVAAHRHLVRHMDLSTNFSP
jgi:hypothetical protein